MNISTKTLPDAVYCGIEDNKMSSIPQYLACIDDPTISMQAYAVYVYLMSRPPEDKVSLKDLAKRFNCGRTKVYSAINELISKGYAARHQDRDRENHGFSEVYYSAIALPIVEQEASVYLQSQ